MLRESNLDWNLREGGLHTLAACEVFFVFGGLNFLLLPVLAAEGGGGGD